MSKDGDGPRLVPPPPSLPPDPQRVQEFEWLRRTLQAERQYAARIVPPLLRDTSPETWSLLAERQELQTCGVVDYLGTAVTDALTKDAGQAHAIAELAASLAETIPGHAYPAVTIAHMRGHAWKNVGKTLRYLSRYTEALEALTRAEAVLLPFPGLVHDRAIVRFHVAAALQESTRYQESIPILAECKEIFREFGDTHLLALTVIAEGLLLQRLGRYREAREKHLLLLASTRDIRLDSLAAIHQCIGFCSVELGDFAEAEVSLSLATQLWRSQGEQLNALKAEMGRGRAFLRRGDARLALRHLRDVRRELIRASLREEAGLCGLSMVEALLSLDMPSQAEELARKIIAEFTAAALNVRAIEALGYLSEAIRQKKASMAMVEQVREYVISLRTAPERDFHFASV